MSKLASALGEKYQQNRISVLTRTFELGNHTFKVRVPAVHEIEAIYNYFKNPDIEKIDLEYQNLTKDLAKLKDAKDEKVVFTDNDIVVDGRSMREAAKNKVAFQHRIVEFIKLLIPENGESLDDLEYSDVESEWPLAIQLELIDSIDKAISPDYENVRGK